MRSAYLARTRRIDAVVALDDYDVQTAADLREHLRLPGLGSSAARRFRDKLAMRISAQAAGIPVPAFVHILNYDRLREFMSTVPSPWVLKPRSEASSMGIKQIHTAEELWPQLDTLGDRQSFFLLEQFIPGDVYHVDSVVWDGVPVFAATHRYGLPPMTVYQGGGVFASSTLPHGGDEDQALRAVNRQVITALGMHRGVTHAEFIRGGDTFYFLECASRVGGAGVDQLVEYASGVNPWVEWARVEVANLRGETYAPPPQRQAYAGLMVSLARQEWPDTTAYDDPEIVWRLHKRHHVGLIVQAAHHAARARVDQRLCAAHRRRLHRRRNAVGASARIDNGQTITGLHRRSRHCFYPDHEDRCRC